MKHQLALLTRVLARDWLALALLGALVLVLLAHPIAWAGDGNVYGNIGPASPTGTAGLLNRYPIANYQLDQYFPAIEVGLFSGVSTSGLLPMIAYFIAQVIWLITAFIAYLVVTLFAFAFSLDLVNGNGTSGSGALAPVSQAIHNIYNSTFGSPWLIVAVALVGVWAMWKALVQRRYTETAGALAVSLLFCVLALGIVTQPQRTIGPASKLANELSTGLLSITSHGELAGEQAAKQASSDQLFSLLVIQPWTVLEFGGTEHCIKPIDGKQVSVPVQPLSTNPTQAQTLGSRLQSTSEIKAPDEKTCINDQLKYDPHFLAFPFQSKERNQEYTALQHGSDSELPEADTAKHNSGSYPLGPADQPAAEAAGKGGQYERLLLALVILVGELGAWLLLGSLAIGVITAGVFLLLTLAFAPFALVIGVIPGRGHAFFRGWLAKLTGYLLRKVIYSAILAVLLAICAALQDATSSLGWLMAFALQAVFLWAVFLQRHKLAGDLMSAATGSSTAHDGLVRLQTLYYASRLSRLAGLHRTHTQTAAPIGGHGREKAAVPTTPPATQETNMTPPRGINVPEPGEYTGEPIASSEGGLPPMAPELSDTYDEEPIAGSEAPLPIPQKPSGVAVPEPMDAYHEPLPPTTATHEATREREAPAPLPSGDQRLDPDEEPA